MNLSPGDYDISIRLMGLDKNYAIDNHHCRYKLIVNGMVYPGSLVQLDHNWEQAKRLE